MDDDLRRQFDEVNAMMLDAFAEFLTAAKGVQSRLVKEEGWTKQLADKVAAEYLATGMAALRSGM